MKALLCAILLGTALTARAAAEVFTLKNAAVFTAAGAVALGYDNWIESRTNHKHTLSMTRLSRNIGQAGEGAYLGGAVALFFAGGKLFGSERTAETAFLAGESFLAANAAGTILKAAVGRSRPYAGDGPLRFRPFNMKGESTSFPSGHTVSAFSVASVVAARSEGTFTPVAAYGLATVVGLQRLYARRHWVSDVAAGAFIGTYVGRKIAASAAARAPAATVWVLPELDEGYSGLRAAWAF